MISLLPVHALAQESVQDSAVAGRGLPVIFGVQFQNFALPFRDMGSHFGHPGAFAGSEIRYNKKGTLVQQAVIGGYANREIGNGIYLATHFGFRPRLYQKWFGEFKAGVGYLAVFHPVPAYEFTDGQWEQVRGGRSQLTIPFDIGLGYTINTNSGSLAPYFSYQVSPALFYNQTLPLNLYTNFILGIRMNLQKQ